jgi:mannose-6-phosphate isomerase-like protein (cupin superfamily)
MNETTNNSNEYPNFPFRGPRGKENALKHYQWGEACDGWNLVDENMLSVKLERMPPNTAEQKHFHRQAQQFFFILKGEAVFEIGDEKFLVKTNHGIHIEPMQEHRIINETHSDLEFILSSQPSTSNDRINCE